MVAAVEEPHAHAAHAGSRRRQPLAIASCTPFSTAGMKPCGMTPPLISLTNSKSCSQGSIVMWQSPNWPRPPVCFLWRPCAVAVPRIVSW